MNAPTCPPIPQPRARLGKAYSNHTGRRFQRVHVHGPGGEERIYDILCRGPRDRAQSDFGVERSTAQCKAEALARFAGEEGMAR